MRRYNQHTYTPHKPVFPRTCTYAYLSHHHAGLKNFPKTDLINFYIAHNEFIRCVVPEERLIEVCITCGNVDVKKLVKFLLPDTNMKDISKEALELLQYKKPKYT